VDEMVLAVEERVRTGRQLPPNVST